MAQFEVELILLRQVASYLAMPIFLVDGEGTLIFYNEAAEGLLGQRYEETGEMALEEWASDFVPTDADGRPLAPEDLPLVTAVNERRPDYGGFFITGLDGVTREITVAAIPLVGQGERELGSMAVFWEKS